MSTMTLPRIAHQIEYPESDGEPMAETDLHRREMNSLIESLAAHYHDTTDVYVAGNLFVYYEEGDPTARFAPDVFVVFGVPKHDRRTYRLWEESHAPAFVLEVTSRKTRLEDIGNKKALCAELGVAEYFLFDPANEYLRPQLQGFRLDQGNYQPLAPDVEGALFSEVLGLRLKVDGRQLRLIEPATGRRLLRPDEAMQAHRAAQAELERLRAELDTLRGTGKS